MIIRVKTLVFPSLYDYGDVHVMLFVEVKTFESLLSFVLYHSYSKIGQNIEP